MTLPAAPWPAEGKWTLLTDCETAQVLAETVERAGEGGRLSVKRHPYLRTGQIVAMRADGEPVGEQFSRQYRVFGIATRPLALKQPRSPAAKEKHPMATKHTVVVECDYHSEGDDAAALKTVQFAHAGRSYEADVCAEHASLMEEVFGGWTENAREVKGAPAPRRRQRRTAEGRQRSAEIRAWAQETGRKVSDRGRIPAGVVSAYEAAHAA